MRHIIFLLLLTFSLSGCDQARFEVQKQQYESELSTATEENDDLLSQLDELKSKLREVEIERNDALHNRLEDERKVAYYFWCESIGNRLKICPNNLSIDGFIAHKGRRNPSWLWLAIYFLTTLFVMVITPTIIVEIRNYPLLKLQEIQTVNAINQFKKEKDIMAAREKEVLENVAFVNDSNSRINEKERKAKKLNQDIKELTEQEKSLMRAIKKHEEDIEKLKRLNDSFKKL